MKIYFILFLCFIGANALAESIFIKKGGAESSDSQIKISSKNVPYYPSALLNKKNVKIPVLNVGKEENISINTEFKMQGEEILNIIKQTPIIKKQEPIAPVKMLKDMLFVSTPKPPTLISDKSKPTSIPENPQIKLHEIPELKNDSVNLVNYRNITDNELKLFQALVLLDTKKQKELAMGLLLDLLDDKTIATEAEFHYGRTAKEIGLPSEFRFHILQAAKNTKDKQLKEQALLQLADNMNYLEVSDIDEIEKLSEQLEIDTSNFHKYQLARGKYFMDKNDLTLAFDALVKINEKNSSYREGRILLALLEYRRGNLDEAIKILAQHQSHLEKQDDLYSLNAVTLARMYLQKSHFKEAYSSYLKVSKDSPYWLQAMVETAWTQILNKDYEGAAGNMFSLHTDFFKHAYAPESYIVRSVGYLNLCQYGDAMSVIEVMKRKYSFLNEKIKNYKKENKVDKYYDTLKLWAQNPQLKEADGLPRSFLAELASHPSFTSIQREINNLSDESDKINNMTLRLFALEKELTSKIDEINKNKDLSADKKNKEISIIKNHIEITKKARVSLSPVRKKAIIRIDTEKVSLKKLASEALFNRFKVLEAQIDKVLEQYESLQYEIYSGAGEHLRYQMAGGDENNQKRDELKPETMKSLKWQFKGEIWEDEIGHYRSSLKNVCPST